MEQNYANHRHSPRLTNGASFLWALSFVAFARYWWSAGRPVTLGIALLSLMVCLFTCVVISRVYVTGLQNRIIRLEMRVRTAAFLTPAQQAALFSLRTSQIVGLRFASDAEMPALLERAIREGLTGEQIKRAIQTWVPDWHRT
jgi:hypothetical protein